MTHSPSDAQGFLALAFLQPYAELLRWRAALKSRDVAYAVCPFCNRRPGFGVMRQMGDGASRSLVCSFCLAEWEFRRLVCPGCGEENDKKLPVFTADDFDYIRVECCESCKTYIKTVDLTKNGRAEPLVDELASAPLDLWVKRARLRQAAEQPHGDVTLLALRSKTRIGCVRFTFGGKRHSGLPTSLWFGFRRSSLPDEFNAASYFIDRHMSEGRAEKIAIECGDIRGQLSPTLRTRKPTGKCAAEFGRAHGRARSVALAQTFRSLRQAFSGRSKSARYPSP